jgi:S-DNA-T family DNA segregation ATPase FtsK/SpoIIIE
VGGATNMGKSVLVNSILTGLLCRFTPEQLKLIVVDPKLVEFKVFEDIPHLLLPVVNDPADASQALKWAVGETKRRYLEMQKVSAKNLEAYNKKVSEGKVENAEQFPYILIIIDELAELMLTAKKDVEQSIVRLSQLARAAGIHLIMATQRPSADVVTGLIKSNCPSRAALRVASASDSRIVLDCSGAEQLLGRGDMFFTNAGPMGLRRMQGSFVSDEEIERVCDFWREQGEPSYREEILAPEDDALAMELEGGAENVDALFSDVLEFAKEKGKVSTSLIQRRFQIGYTRAARIMDQLEQRGIVGEPGAAGKARDVIM